MPRPTNSLDQWYKLVEGLVPTPRTFYRIGLDLTPLAYGEEDEPLLREFTQLVTWYEAQGEQLGYPLFIRTGLLSGKHSWVDTCYVTTPPDLGRHISALVEESATVDFMGLPADVWVARELLPTEAAFTAFDGFPVTRERRYFVDGGQVIGHHPYWPPEAIREYGAPDRADWEEVLEKLNREPHDEVDYLTMLSRKVAAVMEGYWSVDWLWTERGWFLIDMARGEDSYVWKDYPTAPQRG